MTRYPPAYVSPLDGAYPGRLDRLARTAQILVKIHNMNCNSGAPSFDISNMRCAMCETIPQIYESAMKLDCSVYDDDKESLVKDVEILVDVREKLNDHDMLADIVSLDGVLDFLMVAMKHHGE